MQKIKQMNNRLDALEQGNDEEESIDYSMLSEKAVRELLESTDDDGDIDLSKLSLVTLNELDVAFIKGGPIHAES